MLTYARKILRALATTVFILAFTAVLVECAYRYYLSTRVAAEVDNWSSKFKTSERPTFAAYGVAPWFFDRVGHSFTNGPWRVANISAGEFASCASAGSGNRLGNIGWLGDDYATADVRLMILGSSFSMAPNEKGQTIEQVLMERLKSRLHRSVSVLNYARDSTGVLAYIDMARFKYEESRPQAVIAMIQGPSLIWRRHWRVVVPEDDGFRRLFFLLDPNVKPTDVSQTVMQPFVISDAVTEEWCHKMTQARARGDDATLREDPLITKLIAEQNRLQHDVAVPKIAIDFWRHDVSFVWNLLTTGDPFTGMTLFIGRIYDELPLERYTDDPDFNASIKRLKELGVPVIPVHVPTLADMRQQPDGSFAFAANGLPPRQATSLAADLERALGEPFVHLYQYYPSELKSDPLKLVISETDSHPNHLGVDVMAEALERMLLQHPSTAGLLKPGN
jgi:hypothetical protein